MVTDGSLCPAPGPEELHSLLKALVLFQYDRLAQKLQLAYEEALLMMEAAIPEVWSDGGLPSQTPVRGLLWERWSVSL